jgi:valyl-tRNA synthetase
MTDDGHINDKGAAFAGLTLEDARTRILEELRERGDLAGEEPHDMIVGRCERSNDVIEPRLKTQWFIHMRPMADRAMAAVNEGRTKFIQAHHRKVFFDWMENIHDWNVSRQLWWGHRIPAWCCPDGHITVSDLLEGPAACAVCGRPAAELRQEEDIFDTWFSSGMWPFSTLGWPDQTPDLEKYYPTTVMETGYDILFFWVARMMMLGEWLTGREPFRYVYLHGIVRDPLGQKMSKSKGNVLDPLGVINELGADALRFALLHGPEPSQDQKMSRPRLEDARNFANKIWNAARFVLSVRPAEMPAGFALGLTDHHELGPAEHWILARSEQTLGAVDAAYANFEFGEVARLLYDAIWNDFCDWYVELAKIGLADASAEAGRKLAIWSMLTWVLDRYLRLLHPLMPMITEEIWGRLPHRADDPVLLIVAPWPMATDAAFTADAERAGGAADLIELVSAIRSARAESGIEAADILPAQIWLADGPARAAYDDMAAAVARLARVTPTFVADRAALGDGLAVVTGVAEARLTRSEADRERERARLDKELAALAAQLASIRARLSDANFTGRARADVVDQARRRAAELEAQVAALGARRREV